MKGAGAGTSAVVEVLENIVTAFRIGLTRHIPYVGLARGLRSFNGIPVIDGQMQSVPKNVPVSAALGVGLSRGLPIVGFAGGHEHFTIFGFGSSAP